MQYPAGRAGAGHKPLHKPRVELSCNLFISCCFKLFHFVQVHHLQNKIKAWSGLVTVDPIITMIGNSNMGNMINLHQERTSGGSDVMFRGM